MKWEADRMGAAITARRLLDAGFNRREIIETKKQGLVEALLS